MVTVCHDDLGEGPDTANDQIELMWQYETASEPDFSEVTGEDMHDAMKYEFVRDGSQFFETVYLLAIAGF